MPRFLTLAAVMGFATAAAANPPSPHIPALPTTDGALLSVWTQFIAGSDLSQPNSAIELRYVLMGKDQDCTANVTLDQQPVGNAVASRRAAMEGQYHHAKDKTGTTFHVTICAAPLGPATTSVTMRDDNGNVRLVYPATDPNAPNAARFHAVVPGPAAIGEGGTIRGIAMGDSGCRGMPDHGYNPQDCTSTARTRDAEGWVLAELAESAAALDPHFVLHVGDYHYFWEDDGYWTWGEGVSDRFEYWMQEFLLPAGPLLRAAPWIMTRGNHERCTNKWFGRGFHALFDPRPSGQSAGCATPIDKTWAVDIAAPGIDPYRFVVIDTAQGRNGAAFIEAAKHSVTINQGQSAWITHYPPIKMAHYGGQWNYGENNPPSASPIYQDITAAYPGGAVSPCMPGKPCVPEAIFVGHQHFYQSFQFDDATGLPLVLIVGHGGTAAGRQLMPGESSKYALASRCEGDFAGKIPFPSRTKTAVANLETAQVFGFLELGRDAYTEGGGIGWEIKRHWYAGAPAFEFEDDGRCPT